MSQLTTRNVRIAGVSACVPKTIEENTQLSIFESEDEARKVIESTGIERHRRVDDGVTASDLSFKAVERLVKDLNWDIQSIDLLLYVCATRDYVQPMTSPILQDRLGLRQDCFVPVGSME